MAFDPVEKSAVGGGVVVCWRRLGQNADRLPRQPRPVVYCRRENGPMHTRLLNKEDSG
ncbi:hypothetical protein [Desulfuromonas thiophila]|uniref:hypothetical protein n=1 Tax=Desulfuromonas thiophila TaxID=57664 RepID=UPI00149559DA|nr:hypothetical protein [Desulfuromonas thiophila]